MGKPKTKIDNHISYRDCGNDLIIAIADYIKEEADPKNETKNILHAPLKNVPAVIQGNDIIINDKLINYPKNYSNVLADHLYLNSHFKNNPKLSKSLYKNTGSAILFAKASTIPSAIALFFTHIPIFAAIPTINTCLAVTTFLYTKSLGIHMSVSTRKLTGFSDRDLFREVNMGKIKGDKSIGNLRRLDETHKNDIGAIIKSINAKNFKNSAWEATASLWQKIVHSNFVSGYPGTFTKGHAYDVSNKLQDIIPAIKGINTLNGSKHDSSFVGKLIKEEENKKHLAGLVL